MPAIDLNALLNSVKDAATGILQKDVTTVGGFAQDQLTLLGQQAQGIAEMQLAGIFDASPELKDHFVSGLEEMTRNFLKTLKGLLLITIEKLWNAVVKVVWDAIDTATGVAFPRPLGGI